MTSSSQGYSLLLTCVCLRPRIVRPCASGLCGRPPRDAGAHEPRARLPSVLDELHVDRARGSTASGVEEG
eukprot:6685846-Alexandrium_andersonii.AAC.1